MSLVINSDNLKNFIQIPFSTAEKENKNSKEINNSLLFFKTKQTLINDQILFFNLPRNNNKNHQIKILNKLILKNYFNILKLIKKKEKRIDFFNEFVQYIIHISVLKKNTTIHITDVKGQLKLFCSASYSLKLLGRQKTMQPKVLIKLTKYLLKKAYFLKKKLYRTNKESLPIAYFLKKKLYRTNKKSLPIALHSKFINQKFLKLITVRLKKKIDIKTIRFSNFYPHNGCRNKKIRRLKHRKKNKKTRRNSFVYTNLKKKISKLFIKPNLNFKRQYEW